MEHDIWVGILALLGALKLLRDTRKAKLEIKKLKLEIRKLEIELEEKEKKRPRGRL